MKTVTTILKNTDPRFFRKRGNGLIPKKIHYCWFGEAEMSALAMRCLDTWRRHLPGYQIKLWNESNSPIDHPIVRHALSSKMWAFAADYTRLYALYNEGGVYLDTDMEVIKPLDRFLFAEEVFFGEESEGVVSAGIIGARPGSRFISSCLESMEAEFKRGKRFVPIPSILTNTFESYDSKSSCSVYETDYFYPYNPYNKNVNVYQLMYSDITERTHAIHHWEKSWNQGVIKRVFNKARNKFFDWI